YKNWTLYCSCGSKDYNDELLTCHHPQHQRESSSEVNPLSTRSNNCHSKTPGIIDFVSTCTDKDVLLRTLNELKGSVDKDTKLLIDRVISNNETLFTLVRTECFISIA